MSGTDSALIPALRQYRHNSDAYPGFVVGYDKAETDAVITLLRAELAKITAENTRFREALEELARLGNGRLYGNSDGNMIARAALAADGEEK